MGVSNHVIGNQSGVAAHFVQFFDSDDTRHEAVSAFLAQGYLSGCPLILIARPRNSKCILNCLEQTGVPVERAVASGRLTVVDAAEMLRRISRVGSPDGTLFEDALGTLITTAARDGVVYAYGEMVDILAERGEFADAVILEQWINRFLLRRPIAMMCGYSAAHFVASGSQDALRDVCTVHSDVRVESQDPLAAWLLAQAQ
jgi:hypothetical protein